jgi:predicted nucleic acid-binding protein
VLVPQVLTEYWSVVTRPAESNGFGLAPDQAVNEIELLKRQFELIYDSPDCYQHWERLVKLHGVRGKQAHDANLVGAMLAHGIPAILTLNRADFERFPEIQVLSP